MTRRLCQKRKVSGHIVFVLLEENLAEAPNRKAAHPAQQRRLVHEPDQIPVVPRQHRRVDGVRDERGRDEHRHRFEENRVWENLHRAPPAQVFSDPQRGRYALVLGVRLDVQHVRQERGSFECIRTRRRSTALSPVRWGIIRGCFDERRGVSQVDEVPRHVRQPRRERRSSGVQCALQDDR